MKIRILLLLVAILPFYALAEDNPSQILEKAVAKVSSAKGLKSSFNISGKAMSNMSGTFEGTGRKFKLTLPGSITWYDGKQMWTSNQSSKQITLVSPTAQEINEVNPFAYLNSYKGKYNVYFSKRKDANRYLVVLNPKNSNDAVKAVEIAINKKTMLPERFIIRDRNDNRSTISISSLSLNNAYNEAFFSCPLEKMKDYELVDLR